MPGYFGPADPLLQVRLVDDDETLSSLDPRNHVHVLSGKGGRPVQDQHAALTLIDSLERYVDADLLHAIGPVPDPGGVPQHDRQPVEIHRLLDEVARGPRRRRDDRPVDPQERVQKARLADVRPPDDTYPDALADQAAPFVAVQERSDPVDDTRDPLAQLLALEQLDLFLRKVDGGFHLHQGIHQVFPQRLDFLRQTALHLAQRHTGCLVRA